MHHKVAFVGFWKLKGLEETSNLEPGTVFSIL
jgi:hypothetical protein